MIDQFMAPKRHLTVPENRICVRFYGHMTSVPTKNITEIFISIFLLYDIKVLMIFLITFTYTYQQKVDILSMIYLCIYAFDIPYIYKVSLHKFRIMNI